MSLILFCIHVVIDAIIKIINSPQRHREFYCLCLNGKGILSVVFNEPGREEIMIRKLSRVLLVICLCAAYASAADNDRDMKKEEAIWQQLQAVAPDQVENFKKATEVMDADNVDEAIRLYQQVYEKAPKFDPVLRRLGSLLVYTERTAEGLPMLEAAVNINGSPENYFVLARCLAYPGKDREGAKPQKERALGLAKTALDLKTDAKDFEYAYLVAQLALELDKTDLFREATAVMVKHHQDQMITHYFNAIRAAIDEEWTTAEDEIRQAGKMGLPAERVEKFLASGVSSNAAYRRYAYYAAFFFIAWALGLLAIFLLGKLMSNMTLKSLESADPNATVNAQELNLRKYYKILIDAAGTYYYISQPVVILLVIGIAGGIVMAFMALGRLPVKLVAILAIGAVITVYHMIRALLVKVAEEDPGRPLKPEEAPALWALTRAVAESLGTRPVDEIRVTVGTDMAVYERGSKREKAQDRAQRILIVGVGLLNGFQQNAFRAVLAHEYGHFSHRDTAGGDVALRVNQDMIKFAEAIAMSGHAVWWNIGFQFVRLYHFIFRRISHGATRLQEVQADRVAALTYGAAAFSEGLKHVVSRQAEFDLITEIEINNAIKAQRGLQNLYELKLTGEASLSEEIEKLLNSPTTEDDTHPSPADRFRYVNRITSCRETPLEGEVWDLFADRESLTAEMSATIETLIKNAIAAQPAAAN